MPEMSSKRSRRALGRRLAWGAFWVLSMILIARFASIGLRLTDVPQYILLPAQVPIWGILLAAAIGISGAALYLAQRRTSNLPHVTRAGGLAFCVIAPGALALLMGYHAGKFGGFSQILSISDGHLYVSGTLSAFQPEVERLSTPTWHDIRIRNLSGQAYYTAETIADIAYRKGVHSANVSGECAEACPMLWLAMSERSHSKDTRLGIAGSPGDHDVPPQTYRAALTFALVQAGVTSERASEFVSSVPADGLSWLDAAAVTELGIRSSLVD